jgi:hypothetical protein
MSSAYREAVHVLVFDVYWLSSTYSACAVVRVRIDVIVHILMSVVYATHRPLGSGMFAVYRLSDCSVDFKQCDSVGVPSCEATNRQSEAVRMDPSSWARFGVAASGEAESLTASTQAVLAGTAQNCGSQRTTKQQSCLSLVRPRTPGNFQTDRHARCREQCW